MDQSIICDYKYYRIIKVSKVKDSLKKIKSGRTVGHDDNAEIWKSLEE